MRDKEMLSDGVTTVIRIGNTVLRTSNTWTASVHALLKHIRTRKFLAAPEVLGFDCDGREILSYLEGQVYNYPLPPVAKSKSALKSAAKLLRSYHDATVNFIHSYQGHWQLDAHLPMEVICHGDYAPYNCVMKDDEVIGIIDFDTAHPGSRIWDVAYAVYRFAPLTAPENKDGFGSREEQADRLKIFCNEYGLSDSKTLIPTVLKRLTALVNFMYARANAGDKAYLRHIEQGHDKLYLRDLEYIKNNEGFFFSSIN
jgi:Ser/Thr protein kinase RdoA (MazF antagonist)